MFLWESFSYPTGISPGSPSSPVRTEEAFWRKGETHLRSPVAYNLALKTREPLLCTLVLPICTLNLKNTAVVLEAVEQIIAGKNGVLTLGGLRAIWELSRTGPVLLYCPAYCTRCLGSQEKHLACFSYRGMSPHNIQS